MCEEKERVKGREEWQGNKEYQGQEGLESEENIRLLCTATPKYILTHLFWCPLPRGIGGQLSPSQGMRPLLLVCSTLSPLQHKGSGDHGNQEAQENSAGGQVRYNLFTTCLPQ